MNGAIASIKVKEAACRRREENGKRGRNPPKNQMPEKVS